MGLDCEHLRNEAKTLMDDIMNLVEELRSAREDAVSITSSEDLLIACLRASSPELIEDSGRIQIDVQQSDLDGYRMPESLDEMSCQQVVKEVVRLASIKSSLTFALSDLQQKLRTESIRLAGLVALCRHFEPDIANSVYERVLDQMLRKYVGV